MSADPVLAALCEPQPQRKCALVAMLDERAPPPAGGSDADAGAAAHIPGRPERPLRVHPRDVKTRGLGTPAGRAALVHAVAHIEFNAINLALDAAWRFGAQMPAQFRSDWISVAMDEARHFALLRTRLLELGADYGDLPAHDGLWEAAEKTAHDVLERMACVPRVLEARGLDVTPGMIGRLEGAGDGATAAILRTILAEEVRHVAIGTHWFRWLCERRALDAVVTFRALLATHGMQLRPPFNLEARAAAGFTAEEFAPTAGGMP